VDSLKVVTWNVNSVRARQERLMAWLDRQKPDILCLQELKVVEEAFPFESLEESGYSAAMLGQKTYNGVAIISRDVPLEVCRGLTGRQADDQARFISARFGELTIACAYFPNGKEVGSDKYEYKLSWMESLKQHLASTYSPEEKLILCGDFNVAPNDLDVKNIDQWRDSVLCHSDARQALEGIRQWGLMDCFEKHHPKGGIYTWWDYRMLGFPKNNGLRIDHLYATRPMYDRCTAIEVDREERKGKKPSDHAPVIGLFEV
jgi:exodeoxyribonuclease-3